MSLGCSVYDSENGSFFQSIQRRVENKRCSVEIILWSGAAEAHVNRIIGQVRKRIPYSEEKKLGDGSSVNHLILHHMCNAKSILIAIIKLFS